jgi:hypothetical protein
VGRFVEKSLENIATPEAFQCGGIFDNPSSGGQINLEAHNLTRYIQTISTAWIQKPL